MALLSRRLSNLSGVSSPRRSLLPKVHHLLMATQTSKGGNPFEHDGKSRVTPIDSSSFNVVEVFAALCTQAEKNERRVAFSSFKHVAASQWAWAGDNGARNFTSEVERITGSKWIVDNADGLMKEARAVLCDN